MQAIQAHRALLQRLTRLDESELGAIREAHPSVPTDYLTFMRDAGWGGVGARSDLALFMIYSGPAPPSELLGDDEETRALDQRYLVFGDDYGGNLTAFSLQSGEIVEIDHEDRSCRIVGSSFDQFMLQLLPDMETGPRPWYFVLKSPRGDGPPDKPFSVQLLDKLGRAREVVHFAAEHDVVVVGGAVVDPGVIRAALSRRGDGDGMFVDDVGNEVGPDFMSTSNE